MIGNTQKIIKMKLKAIVYSENQFGKNDGKVANGLLRHSEKYEIIGIIDSSKAHQMAENILEGETNETPIFSSIDSALETLEYHPDYFIYGLAPSKPKLSKKERQVFFEAMENGMNIINGLPEFLSEDPEFIDCAEEFGVTITDVRKPISKDKLHHFTGKINRIKTPVIAIMGTDCAIGKRTTAQKLVKALKIEGLNVAFIATGQTGLLQGAKYGAAIDMLSSGYATGEVENAILEAVQNENPDIVIVEGQGSLGHPSYTSSAAILKGSKPKGIIIQHAPKRQNFCTFPNIKMNSLQSEINLIEGFIGSSVMAITINHENMTKKEIDTTVKNYEKTFGLPTTDVLKHGCNKLIDMIYNKFPDLQEGMKQLNKNSI